MSLRPPLESGQPRGVLGPASKTPMLPKYYQLRDAFPDTYWRYVARHGLFFQLWAKHRERRARYRVLDIGCGSGGLLAYLASRTPIVPVGVDLFAETLPYCRQRGIRSVSVAEATALPFRSGIFDFVVAQDLIEHVRDDASAMGEMFRVCAPGGMALVVVPAFQSLWSTRDIQLGHHRRYAIAEIADCVTSAGFQVLHRTYTDLLLLPLLKAAIALAPRGVDGVPDLALNAPGGTGLMNRALLALSRLEAACARRMTLPFGVSTIILSRKPANTEREP